MLRIKKRDGNIEEFDITKIENAIEKAFMAEHKFYNHDIIEMLALRVTSDFNRKVVNDTIGIEDVQDSVEIVLIQAGYVDVARSYMIYRKQHQNLRDIKETNLNYKNVVDNYLKINDWRVKENSTVTYSVGGLILSNSGAVTANYWLSEVYDDEIIIDLTLCFEVNRIDRHLFWKLLIVSSGDDIVFISSFHDFKAT